MLDIIVTKSTIGCIFELNFVSWLQSRDKVTPPFIPKTWRPAEAGRLNRQTRLA
jgi:hypothetical protein